MSSRIIRNIDSSGTMQGYWTGSKFSADINEAKEFTSGRELARDTAKSKKVLKTDPTITNKEIIISLLYTDSALESAFQSNFQLARNWRSVNNVRSAKYDSEIITQEDIDAKLAEYEAAYEKPKQSMEVIPNSKPAITQSSDNRTKNTGFIK